MPKCTSFIDYDNRQVSLLSYTEDMHCFSFSLPAGASCPMMVADSPDHICSGCYAMQNRYNMPNVLTAQWVRFLWVRDLMKSRQGRKHFVNTMVAAIKKHAKNGYFRFFDSGDLFSPMMVICCYKICRDLPDIKFWLPTRSYQSTSWRWEIPLEALASLPNVSVRPSALKWDEAPPRVPYLSAGTTGLRLKPGQRVENLGSYAYREGKRVKICPKTKNGGSCETNSCRTCWGKTTSVGYVAHGVNGQSVVHLVSDRVREKRREFGREMTLLTIQGEKV